ncbi:MAG: hypothetical protein ACRDA4_10025 [Filifactoraceae bacterium]
MNKLQLIQFFVIVPFGFGVVYYFHWRFYNDERVIVPFGFGVVYYKKAGILLQLNVIVPFGFGVVYYFH